MNKYQKAIEVIDTLHEEITAREMFESLGYKYGEESDERYNYKVIKYYDTNTKFVFSINAREFAVSYCEEPKYTTVDEFKAIHQQLKELGWLEEETCTNKTYKKPTYKLKQCEYDILDTIFEKEARFSKVYLIGELKKKGYFKNIKCDSNVRVKNILANCEVVGWFISLQDFS